MPTHRRLTVRPRSVAVLAGLLVVGTAWGLHHRSPQPRSGGDLIWERGLHDLGASLDNLETAFAGADTAAAQRAFRAARRDFKRIESLLYFYSPILTAEINSPRFDDDDVPHPLPLATPIGFQILEAALFDGDPSLDSARQETARMRWVVGQFAQLARHTRVSDTALVEAARIELARVTTLGLAGFDVGSSGDSRREGAEALEGLATLLEVVRAPDSLRAAAQDALRRAAAEFGDNPLRFITAFSNPAAQAVGALRSQIGVPTSGIRTLWRRDAASVFDSDAMDPYGFAPASAGAPAPAVVDLGRRLFLEQRLSGPGDRSCATCHDPRRAFTDGRAHARALPGAKGAPLRNTPTLWNAAFQPSFFADDRARSLEAQVGIVLSSPAEMASSPELAAARLTKDSSYRAAFGSAITGLAIRQALGAYERTLTALNSRFDRAVRGDTLAMTATERAGLTVFLGKGRCGTCHFMPLFNGVQPPDFKSAEPEIIGVTVDTNFRNPRLDPDVGRGAVEMTAVTRFAFKVPTLRNIALTAPYMHNGAFPTLESVIDFYNAGGGAGLGARLSHPTLATDSLRLTRSERRALIAFLRALTDTTVMTPLQMRYAMFDAP